MIQAGAKSASGGVKSGLTSEAYQPAVSGEKNNEVSATAPKTRAKEKTMRRIFFMAASRNSATLSGLEVPPHSRIRHSGCRESNSGYKHPMLAYYHYTTSRSL